MDLDREFAGPYLVSIWTDPDTTDDGSPGGQFWVRLHVAGTGAAVPQATRATVAIKPLGRAGPERTASTSPVRGDVTNQFAVLVTAQIVIMPDVLDRSSPIPLDARALISARPVRHTHA